MVGVVRGLWSSNLLYRAMATNRSAERNTHHDPQSEADRLEFPARTGSASLPAELRAS